VTTISARLSCITAIAGILTLSGGFLVAAFNHEACVVRHHGCTTVLTAASCCDGEHRDLSRQEATALVRDDAARNIAWAPSVTPDGIERVATYHVTLRPAGASPAGRQSDLPIFFSDLRI